jgi:lysophospholipase L1-like esterase
VVEGSEDSASVLDAPTHSDPIGKLENPHTLHHLFETLALLEDGHAHEDVRVIQFGDSHTAADLETGAMRRLLQTRFGDGGRGFVALGKPWPKYPYVQDAIRVGATPEFHPEKGKRAHGRFEGDGCYGLLGLAVQSDGDAVGRAWTETTAHASRVEIDYFEQPNGGSFDVFIDHSKVTRLTTGAPAAQSAWRAFDVADAPHEIEVRSVGDGTVRLFGVALDRATAGITVDALGVNGVTIEAPLSWNEAHFAEQIKHRAPDLIVLAYGTNESFSDMPQATYERKLVDLLGRMARAMPSASCLLLGPPDRAEKQRDGSWETTPKVGAIIETQKRVAEAAGCAFYDQAAAMGGDGSIARWAAEQPPRAGRDRVHLTRTGYADLAGMFVGDLLRAYEVWRADTGLAPTGEPTSPTVTPLPAASDAGAPVQAPRHRRRHAT